MPTTDQPIGVTVLLLTKNEEVGLGACLESLTDFGEVIVVDSNSTDRTVEIARAHGATVVNFTWNGRYPKKKQWQLENIDTLNRWVLMMDADESCTPELLAAIRAAEPEMARHEFAAYDLRLDYVFAGRSLKHGHRVVKRALVDRERVKFPEVNDLDAPDIGEVEGHYQPIASGPIRTLDGRLRHDDKDPVATWFARHNRYSGWEAHLMYNAEFGQHAAAFKSRQGRLFGRVPFKPLAFFLYSYVARAGFLDGRAGYDYAIAQSMYYWQIGLKYRELRDAAAAPSPAGKS